MNGLSLSNVVINLDSAAGGIHLNADVNFWGFGTQFHMISPKSGGGSYSMLYGVTLFTPGTTGNFASGLSWLDAIFNPGHGFSFQNVVFAIASGGGTYSFNGLTVSAQGTGLIMSGELLLQGGGMTSIVSSTGSFGNQLGAMGQGSAYLDFAVAVTESSVQLAIDFSSDMSAGGQSFTQVALVFSTLFQAPQLQFDFAFTYSRVLGGQSLLFLGEFGLQLNDLGGNLNGMFLFEGAWKNPFGLCSQMTIYTIGLSLSLNLETMLPDAFGMVISGQLGQVNVSGQLLVDAATPDTGNAVALSATNLSLGNIVIAFISDIPSWMYDVLNSMSVASVVFRWGLEGTLVVAETRLTLPSGQLQPLDNRRPVLPRHPFHPTWTLPQRHQLQVPRHCHRSICHHQTKWLNIGSLDPNCTHHFWQLVCCHQLQQPQQGTVWELLDFSELDED